MLTPEAIMERWKRDSWFHFFPPEQEKLGWSFQLVRIMVGIPYQGADFNEMYRAMRRVEFGNRSSWVQEWSRLAGHVEGLATAAQDMGRRATARDAYLRASNYYRMASFFTPQGTEQRRASYRKCADLFQKAIALFSPDQRLEQVEIPYENGVKLPGFFLPAKGLRAGEKMPVAIYVGGGDSTKEEMYFLCAPEFAERGMGCIITDFPGHGAALELLGLKIRHDFEVPLKAQVDYLLTRDDVDPDRIGMMGSSFGGYYAPRGAAFENRIKALVVHGGVYSVPLALGDNVLKSPWFIRQFGYLLGLEGEENIVNAMKKFDLTDVARQISCPTFIVSGANDFGVELAQRLYEEIQNPIKEIRIFSEEEGGSTHCMLDNPTEGYTAMIDWLAERLTQPAPLE